MRRKIFCRCVIFYIKIQNVMHQAVQGGSVIQTYCTKPMGTINAWRSPNEKMFLFCGSFTDAISNLNCTAMNEDNCCAIKCLYCFKAKITYLISWHSHLVSKYTSFNDSPKPWCPVEDFISYSMQPILHPYQYQKWIHLMHNLASEMHVWNLQWMVFWLQKPLTKRSVTQQVGSSTSVSDLYLWGACFKSWPRH